MKQETHTSSHHSKCTYHITIHITTLDDETVSSFIIAVVAQKQPQIIGKPGQCHTKKPSNLPNSAATMPALSNQLAGKFMNITKWPNQIDSSTEEIFQVLFRVTICLSVIFINKFENHWNMTHEKNLATAYLEELSSLFFCELKTSNNSQPQG